jgi:site-specific DNA-cytosine methylase
MKVLVACEFSGVVRNAFALLGHDVWSCDLLPTEIVGNHYQGDIRDILYDGWDMMIAHPPCTHLAVSGARYFKTKQVEQEEALGFIKLLLDAPIDMICLENPVGIISTKIHKPDQIIQPWMFGEDASKKTCLWLKNLPLLKPTKVLVKDRYANQTPTGQNNLAPSPNRWKERSRTYQGIADAMASQWGLNITYMYTF